MGNLNKVMLIGRLTREPELTEFKSGGKVADLGFAVHNARKNAQTGEWEEAPVWLNMKAYNHQHGRQLADLAAKLHKGRQVFVEGHLVLQQWTGKEDGARHSKLLVYADDIEFLGERPQAEGAAAPETVAAAPDVPAAAADCAEKTAAKPARAGRRK